MKTKHKDNGAVVFTADDKASALSAVRVGQ